MRRAKSKEEKEVRRDKILQMGRKTIDKTGFSALKVETITKACGLAKGTFYIYFASREELILEVLKEDFDEWFVEFSQYLQQSRKPFGPTLIHFWQQSVVQKPRLLSGLGYLHSSVEPTLGEDLLYRFKTFLLERLKSAHYHIIESFEPFVSLEELTLLFLTLTGISSGLWMQHIGSHATKVFDKHRDLQLLRGDFDTLFPIAAAALLESPKFQHLRKLERRGKNA